MRKYLIYLPIMLLLSCSHNYGEEQTENKIIGENDTLGTSVEYKLINDNLYTDQKGNLFLKSENNEEIGSGNSFDIWIDVVFCDTCSKSAGEWTDIELKDVVDVKTWHYDTSNGYWTEYIDKNFRYHHTLMADGGTISLESK